MVSMHYGARKISNTQHQAPSATALHLAVASPYDSVQLVRLTV